jgi:hypothetical protein
LINAPDEKYLSPEPSIAEKLPHVVFRYEQAELTEKRGVWMRVYITKDDCRNASVLYQETEARHAEELVHKKAISFIIFCRGAAPGS